MPTADIRTADGNVLRSTELDAAIFGIEPNVPVMHQVVTAQLAAARSGTHSTKTRAEVRGGGKKPWRQKGTGRARQGSTRAPHWAGGGVAMGPKPRDYRQKTPKKMVQLALRSALSDRASEGRIAVVDGWQFDAPSTKKAKAALAGLGIEGKVLVVLGAAETEVARSFRNLPEAHIILASELNAYDVLCSDWVLFSEATLPGGEPVTATTAPASSPAAPAAEAGDGEAKWDEVVQGASPAAVVAEAELETAAPTEPVEIEGDEVE